MFSIYLPQRREVRKVIIRVVFVYLEIPASAGMTPPKSFLQMQKSPIYCNNRLLPKYTKIFLAV